MIIDFKQNKAKKLTKLADVLKYVYHFLVARFQRAIIPIEKKSLQKIKALDISRHTLTCELNTYCHTFNRFHFCCCILGSITNIYNLNNQLKSNGMVTKPIGSSALRFSPALIIKEEQLREGLDIIVKTINAYSD